MANGFFGPMRADKQNTPEVWNPFIRLTLTDTGGIILANDVLALIDTGSDVCYIDNELAKKSGLLPKGSTTTSTGTGSKENPVYACVFLIKDRPTNAVLRMATPGMDLSSNGLNHRILLGMEALRNFDLRISQSQQLVELNWAKSPT
jgi:Aspartyl protease